LKFDDLDYGTSSDSDEYRVAPASEGDKTEHSDAANEEGSDGANEEHHGANEEDSDGANEEDSDGANENNSGSDDPASNSSPERQDNRLRKRPRRTNTGTPHPPRIAMKVSNQVTGHSCILIIIYSQFSGIRGMYRGNLRSSMSLHITEIPSNNIEKLLNGTSTVFVVGAGASVAAGLSVNHPHWLSLECFSPIPIDLQRKLRSIHR
jgi:hypothetical protein